MSETLEKEIHTKTADEGYHRGELGYDEEFKKVIRENPGVIRDFLKAVDVLSLRGEGGEVVEGEVAVKLIYSRGRQRVRVYKVEIAGKTYAIRKTERYKKDGPHQEESGLKQFKDSLRAREILKDVPGVEVQEALLGYDDKGHGRRFFVSQWYNFPDLDTYLNNSSLKLELEKIDELKERMKRIKALLKGYGDVEDHNMFYDKSRDTIILFDLHDKSEEVN